MTRDQFGRALILGTLGGVAGYIGWRLWKRTDAERKTDELAENDRMLEEFDYKMTAHKANGSQSPKPRRRQKPTTA